MRSNPLSTTTFTAPKLLPTTKESNNGIAEKELKTDGFISGTLSNRLPDLLQKLKLSLQSDSDQEIDQNIKSIFTYLQGNNFEGIDRESLSFKISILDIEKIFEQKKDSLSENTILDVKELLLALNNKPDPVSDTTDKLVFTTTKQDLKEGFYTANSLSEVQKLAGNTEFSDAVVNTLSVMLEKYGKIVFRVYGDDTNVFFISALAPQTASQELLSVINNLNSQLFKSLPQEVLTVILDRKNIIPLDILKNLDSLLKEATIHFPDERAGSQSAAITASANWLDMTLDSVSMQKNPDKFFPPQIASKIITDAVNINDLLNQFSSNTANLLQLPGITEEFIKSNDKSNAIPLIFSNLGYNLESIILCNKENNLSTNYKAGLLHLRKQFSDTSELSSISNKNNQMPQKELLSYKDETSEKSDILKHSKSTIDNLSDSLKILYRIRSEFNNLFSLQNKDALPSANDISEKFAKVISNVTQALYSIQEKIQLISEQVNITTVQTQLRQLEKLIQDIDNADVNSLPFAIELKKGLSELIMSQSALMSDISSAAKQKLDTDRMVSNSKGLSVVTDQPISLHTQLSHTIESSLGRLESLQLLARPQINSEGQQQMLALPMKIGNEWTEVNITFLKRQKSKKRKQKQSQHYSVSMNLSPKQIGSISIKMEYVQKKSLKISMTFETETTKNYFEKFNTEIRSVLKNRRFFNVFFRFPKKKK